MNFIGYLHTNGQKKAAFSFTFIFPRLEGKIWNRLMNTLTSYVKHGQGI
jgi:hypothetical protein